MSGGLQMRSQSDPRLYNPSRDVVHNFSDVFQRVAGHLEQQVWEDLKAHVDDYNLEMEELGRACQVFVEFMLSAHTVKPRELRELLEKVGWFTISRQVRLAYLACLGLVMVGVYQAGIWEATVMGPTGPLLSSKELVSRANRVARVLAMPRWKWRLWRMVDRLRNRRSKEDAVTEKPQ